MHSTAIELPAPEKPKRDTRIQRTRNQWKSLVDEFTSGLTKTAFWKKHSIAAQCEYYSRFHLIQTKYIVINENQFASISPYITKNPYILRILMKITT